MNLTVDARTAAFGGLIDYAGLFPPTSLAIGAAVDVYRSARVGPHHWILGRFLCPASDLEELAAIATSGFGHGEAPWNIGVIMDRPPGESAALAAAFRREMTPAMRVTGVEVPISVEASVAALVDMVGTIDKDAATFVEVDVAAPLRPQVVEIATALDDRSATGGAKIRCGGLTPEQFPRPHTMATFIVEAANASLSFKATAGLHQPIRHHDPDLDVWRHGFVNILVATAAAADGADLDLVEEIISETDTEAFSVTPMLATWRDLTVPGSAIRRARQGGFMGYGSCDLDEPIEGLEALGFLGSGR
jgi:hypothetical protein